MYGFPSWTVELMVDAHISGKTSQMQGRGSPKEALAGHLQCIQLMQISPVLLCLCRVRLCVCFFVCAYLIAATVKAQNCSITTVLPYASP